MLVICDNQQTADKLAGLGIEAACHINGNIKGRVCTVLAESDTAVRDIADQLNQHDAAHVVPLPTGVDINDVPRRVALLEQHIRVKTPSVEPSMSIFNNAQIAGIKKKAPLWGSELDEQAQTFADSTATSVEMADLPMLAAIGGLGTGLFELEVKAMWREPMVLNAAICDRPGGAKSPLLSAILGCVYQQQMDILNSKLIDATNRKDRFIWSDTTIEAIFRDLGTTGRGGIKHADELDNHYGRAMTRYKQASDRAHWKSAWNGKPTVIDRVGTKGVTQPITIKCFGVSVIGGIQPARLDLIFDQLDDGQSDRTPIIMAEPQPLSKYGSDSTDTDVWEIAVEQMVKWRKDLTGCTVLPFTPEAQEAFLEHRFQTLSRIRQSGRDVEGWIAKSFAHIARVSLITTVAQHALNGTVPEAVDVDAVQRGIEYQKLLNSHRRRARLEVGTPDIERVMVECARYIIESGIEQLDPFELRMNRQVAGLRNEQVVRDVLAELEQARWISTPIPRRKDEPLPKLVRVNPALHNMRM